MIATTQRHLGRAGVVGPHAGTRGSGAMKLLATGDGWSIVGPHGELVYSALGASARQRCLEFARSHGVLALFS